ncbi:MAG: hypothetical protein ACK2T2_10335 [Anaerolineales bacterium]
MLDRLQALEIGGGRVIQQEGASRLCIPAVGKGYANAQLDDYRALPRRDLRWRPPFSLRLRARVNTSAPLGTLGFGLWNDPFSISLGQGGAARRLPAAPQAAWFFYGSPPNDLSLGGDRGGAGWLAMAMRSRRIPAPLLAPAALTAWLLALIPPLRRPLFWLIETGATVRTRPLNIPLDSWHNYRLTWSQEAVEFRVDGEMVFRSPISPRPPLGLVLWIDNQYLCASPASGLRFGTLPTSQEQCLELDQLSVE